MDEIEKQVRKHFGDEGTQQVLALVKAGDYGRLREAARAWANRAWILPRLHFGKPAPEANRMEDRAEFLRDLADQIEEDVG